MANDTPPVFDFSFFLQIFVGLARFAFGGVGLFLVKNNITDQSHVDQLYIGAAMLVLWAIWLGLSKALHNAKVQAALRTTAGSPAADNLGANAARLLASKLTGSSAPILGVLLVAVLFLANCGGNFPLILRSVLAASPFGVQLLVNHKVITQAQADLVSQDLRDEGNLVADYATALDAIPSTLPKNERRAQALAATETLAQRTRTIIERGHFGVSPKLNQISDDIISVLDGALIFYGGSPSGIGGDKGGSLLRGASANGFAPVTEKEIKRRIDLLQKHLQGE